MGVAGDDPINEERLTELEDKTIQLARSDKTDIERLSEAEYAAGPVQFKVTRDIPTSGNAVGGAYGYTQAFEVGTNYIIARVRRADNLLASDLETYSLKIEDQPGSSALTLNFTQLHAIHQTTTYSFFAYGSSASAPTSFSVQSGVANTLQKNIDLSTTTPHSSFAGSLNPAETRQALEASGLDLSGGGGLDPQTLNNINEKLATNSQYIADLGGTRRPALTTSITNKLYLEWCPSGNINNHNGGAIQFLCRV